MNVERIGPAMLLAGVLWATPAFAAESPWDGFDRNGDGRVTFDEVMQQLEPSVRKGFDALDRNHDGVLSAEDFDDVRDGVRKLHRWMEELLRPFMQDDKGGEDSDGKMI